MTPRIYLFVSCCLWYTATSQNTGDLELKDYCLRETFNATCLEGQVVVMQRAQYGRMKLGRCVKQNFGFLGCVLDVMRLLDGMCSGRRSCTVKPNGDALLAINPCPDDTTPYLSVSYSCISVAMDRTHQCHQAGKVTLSQAEGFLSSLMSTDHAMGSTRCPWVIQASPGLKLNITLFNFVAMSVTGSVLSPESSVCYEVGTIREGETSRTVLVCGGDPRHKVIHISKGGPVEISFVDKSILHTLGHFLIHYEAVGCAHPTLPPHAHLKREEGRVMVRCNHTEETWLLNCDDGTWIGGPVHCPSDPSWAASGIFASDDNFPYGILIVVAIGVALGVFIGGLLLSLAIYYIRRKQPPQTVDASEASCPAQQTDSSKFPSSGDIVDPRSPSWGVYGTQPRPYYNRPSSTPDPDKDIYSARHHVYETPQIS